MDMYGGYYMVSLAGTDLAETDPVYIPGAYQAVYKGIHTDKPILIYHVVHGDIKMSPMYGILSKENNVLYLKTLYALIEITSADQVVIIPTPSIDDVEAEIELIRIELENLTGQISDITDSIDDMESEIDSVQGDVTDLQTDLTTVSGKADQALAAAQQAARDLDNLTDVVADLSGDVVDLTRDLTALTSTVTTLSGTVSNLSGTVSNLSSTVSTLGSDVSDLTDDLADEIAYTHGGGLFSALLDYFYPVGSYYETSDASFNPNTEWGGSWISETQGVVHVSAGGSFPISGALDNTLDGGESTHILTPAETATKDHKHTINHGHGFTNPTVNAHNHAASSDNTLNFVRTKTSGGLTLTGQRAYTAASSSGVYYAVTTASGKIGNAHYTDNASPGTSGGAVGDYTGESGGQTEVNGSAHNNMQPYINVARWHRVG